MNNPNAHLQAHLIAAQNPGMPFLQQHALWNQHVLGMAQGLVQPIPVQVFQQALLNPLPPLQQGMMNVLFGGLNAPGNNLMVPFPPAAPIMGPPLPEIRDRKRRREDDSMDED